MKSTIQELMIQVKEQEEKAKRRWMQANYFSKEEDLHYDYFKAFSSIVKKLGLLLDSENEKSSQSSHGDGSNSSNAM